jgi:hypothetical protein
VQTYFLGAQSEGWIAFGKIGFAHWINFGWYEGRSDGQDLAGSVVEITDAILDNRSANCSDYANAYAASATDLQRSLVFAAELEITIDALECTLVSNAIPNHDFNDATAQFATDVAAVNRAFTISRSPELASGMTPLSQQSWDAVMLNGVVLDLLSAGCYRPNHPMADPDGNVPIGCTTNDSWLLDPLGPGNGFGTDLHHAHTQPDGTYHYHGDPMALFDQSPGPEGSPVVGFAADGFPIYGSYFNDGTAVRKAVSGYTLKQGNRPTGSLDPGGVYDGKYVDDWEFTDSGDLDSCNGMWVDGQYGYYVTGSYPWVMHCLVGTPHSSFAK